MELEVPARCVISVARRPCGAALCCGTRERVELGDGHGDGFGMQSSARQAKGGEEYFNASFPQGSEMENKQTVQHCYR